MQSWSTGPVPDSDALLYHQVSQCWPIISVHSHVYSLICKIINKIAELTVWRRVVCCGC